MYLPNPHKEEVVVDGGVEDEANPITKKYLSA
jgi:hypothetical protein